MFVYLKTHHNAEMVFGSSIPAIGMDPFIREDLLQSICGNLTGELLPNIPGPKVLLSQLEYLLIVIMYEHHYKPTYCIFAKVVYFTKKKLEELRSLFC